MAQRTTSAIKVAILCLLFLACKESEKSKPPSIPKPGKVVVLDSMAHPWSIAFLDDDNALITEKDGNLIKANLIEGQKTVVRGFPDDLVDSVRVKDFRDNSGIFDVVLHPRFNENKWIYVSYASENENGTTTKIIRAELELDSLVDLQTIFVATPYRFDLFHYGGGMAFGPDEKLFFTIGERYYRETDQPEMPVAQDVSDKRGKIHRLNDDGTIPNDNPNFGPDAVSSIYAIGIRAAQGITLNKKTDEIWFSEHGPTQGDELNLLVEGANYGWPLKTTGKYRDKDYQPSDKDSLNFYEPIYSWERTIAPTGLVFYTGDEFPDWKGDLILAGLSKGSLWRMKIKEDTVSEIEELFVNEPIRSRKVAMSPNGDLYMLTDEPNGKLIRIENNVK